MNLKIPHERVGASRSKGVIALAALVCLLAACAHPTAEVSELVNRPSAVVASGIVPPFSTARPGAALPDGWESWIVHPRKKPSIYNIAIDSGKPVLRAYANGSASGLITRVDVDPAKLPILRWSWRSDALLHEADNGEAALEDAPVRIVLAFDGDKAILPVRDRLFFERVKLFTGVDMPYATLMYIWANRHPVGTVIPNPHSPRIQKIVVETGPEGLGRWHMLRRNIIEDYRRAFGEDPGRLRGVGVMSDADNTNGEVLAYYGDIQLLDVD